MDKRGQGLSITYIIIIALALIVLVLIAMWFTGALKFLTGEEKGIVKAAVTEKELALWRSQCDLWCSTEDRVNYVNHDFNPDGKYEGADSPLNCKDLIGEPFASCAEGGEEETTTA